MKCEFHSPHPSFLSELKNTYSWPQIPLPKPRLCNRYYAFRASSSWLTFWLVQKLVCIFNSFCYAGAIRYGARPGAVPGWSSIQIWAKRGRVIPFIPPRSIRLRPASGRGDPILFIPKRANSRIFYICPSPTTDLPITAAGSLGVLPEEDIRTTLVFRMRKMVDRSLTPRQEIPTSINGKVSLTENRLASSTFLGLENRQIGFFVMGLLVKWLAIHQETSILPYLHTKLLTFLQHPAAFISNSWLTHLKHVCWWYHQHRIAYRKTGDQDRLWTSHAYYKWVKSHLPLPRRLLKTLKGRRMLTLPFGLE